VTITLKVESDQPVLVLVMPLRKAAPRSVPPASGRPVIETTGETISEATNVRPLRRVAA